MHDHVLMWPLCHRYLCTVYTIGGTSNIVVEEFKFGGMRWRYLVWALMTCDGEEPMTLDVGPHIALVAPLPSTPLVQIMRGPKILCHSELCDWQWFDLLCNHHQYPTIHLRGTWPNYTKMCSKVVVGGNCQHVYCKHMYNVFMCLYKVNYIANAFMYAAAT